MVGVCGAPLFTGIAANSHFSEVHCEYPDTRFIEDTASGFYPPHRCRGLFGCSLDKKFAVESLGAGLRRQDDAGAGDRDGIGIVLAFANGNRERGDARGEADGLRRELIEGETVAKGGLPRMRRSREEALPRMMIAPYVADAKALQRS